MPTFSLLAQQVSNPRAAWAPVVLLIVIGLVFVIGTLAMSLLVGPSRTGPSKETTYESGMIPVGDARRRFHVRFYLVAMIFLVFDVEIVFFYPWATLFPRLAYSLSQHSQAAVLLIEMGIFVAILLVAYLYAWGKGVFRWD